MFLVKEMVNASRHSFNKLIILGVLSFLTRRVLPTQSFFQNKNVTRGNPNQRLRMISLWITICINNH